MSIETSDIPTPPETDEDYAPSNNGVWKTLREQHKAVSEAREPLTLEVPGYDGLWIRYRYVPLSGRNKKALTNVRAQKDPEQQQLWGLVALMVDACDEILVANPSDPRADATGLAPLCDPGEEPIRFDWVLARGMEWPNAEMMTAKAIVRRLFGDEQGDYTLQAHAAEVAEWMGREREPVSEDFAKN